MQNSLLTPSLSQPNHNVRLYSPRSSFFVAFFGGPIAVVLYSMLNSIRLRRWVDGLAYLVAISAVLALYYWLATSNDDILHWIREQLGRRTNTYLFRFSALMLWGAFYLMHKEYHRSAELFDIQPPSPWVPALGCIAAVFITATLLGG